MRCRIFRKYQNINSQIVSYLVYCYYKNLEVGLCLKKMLWNGIQKSLCYLLLNEIFTNAQMKYLLLCICISEYIFWKVKSHIWMILWQDNTTKDKSSCGVASCVHFQQNYISNKFDFPHNEHIDNNHKYIYHNTNWLLNIIITIHTKCKIHNEKDVLT